MGRYCKQVKRTCGRWVEKPRVDVLLRGVRNISKATDLKHATGCAARSQGSEGGTYQVCRETDQLKVKLLQDPLTKEAKSMLPFLRGQRTQFTQSPIACEVIRAGGNRDEEQWG